MKHPTVSAMPVVASSCRFMTPAILTHGIPNSPVRVSTILALLISVSGREIFVEDVQGRLRRSCDGEGLVMKGSGLRLGTKTKQDDDVRTPAVQETGRAKGEM